MGFNIVSSVLYFRLFFCLCQQSALKNYFSSLVVCILVREIARESKFAPLKIDLISSKLINKYVYNIFAIEWKCKLTGVVPNST